MTVSPGDYVVADGSAVVFVAQRDIDGVLDAAEAIARRERAMVDSLLDRDAHQQRDGHELRNHAEAVMADHIHS